MDKVQQRERFSPVAKDLERTAKGAKADQESDTRPGDGRKKKKRNQKKGSETN